MRSVHLAVSVVGIPVQLALASHHLMRIALTSNGG